MHFCKYTCLRVSLYSGKQPFCWAKRAHFCQFNIWHKWVCFREFHPDLYRTLHLFPFVELQINPPSDFKLVFQAASCSPSTVITLLGVLYCHCEGFWWRNTDIVCRGCGLLSHLTSCFPITFEKLGSHVLSMAYISFNCNYFLGSLVKLEKEGHRLTQVSSVGPLVGSCLITLTIWWENAVRIARAEEIDLLYRPFYPT